MSRIRALLTLLVWLIAAAALSAQAPPAPTGRSAPPLGARLRLGGGLQLGGFIQTAALSPDGSLLAALTSSNTCVLYELATGKELRQIGVNALIGAFPTALSFSPDGKTIAFASQRGLALVVTETGKLQRRFDLAGPARFFRATVPSFSADGRVVAMGSEQGGGGVKQRAYVWEIATGKALGPIEVVQTDSVSTALAHDGKTLATWGRHYRRTPNDLDASQLIQLWDVTTGKERRRFSTGRQYVNVAAADFTPDGKTLAAASGSSTFHLFDVATGKEQSRFAGRRAQISFLRVAPDGSTLACGSHDGVLQAWDVASGRRLELPAGPPARLLDVAFPGKGKLQVLGVQGQALVWWDAISGKVANAPEGHCTPVLDLGFSPDGKTLTTASADGVILRWEATTGRRRGGLSLLDESMQRFVGSGTVARYNMLALSPDGRYAATNSTAQSNCVRLWDVSSGQVVCDFESSRPSNNLGIAFSARGDRLVAAGDQSVLNVWNVRTGQDASRISNAPKNNTSVGSAPRVAVAPDGRLVVVGSNGYDRVTGRQHSHWLVYDSTTGKELYSVPGYVPYQGGGATFSPDGQYLALTGAGRSLTLVRAGTGKEWRHLGATRSATVSIPFSGTVYSGTMTPSAVAFAPDGRALAVAYMGQPIYGPTGVVRAAQSSIEVWELAGAGRRAEFAGHHGIVHCLAFSPDGRTLASGGADAAVILWDLTGQAGAKAVTPTGKHLDEAWAALTSADVAAAHQAMSRLYAAPTQTVTLLRQHLQPARTGANEATIRELVSDLNSDSFAARNRATRQLRLLGPAAESALRAAQKNTPSLELRRRIDGLLAKIEAGQLSSEELRAARAIELLERLGTSEARALLDTLAQGAIGAQLTQESRRALKRLN